MVYIHIIPLILHIQNSFSYVNPIRVLIIYFQSFHSDVFCKFHVGIPVSDHIAIIIIYFIFWQKISQNSYFWLPTKAVISLKMRALKYLRKSHSLRIKHIKHFLIDFFIHNYLVFKTSHSPHFCAPQALRLRPFFRYSVRCSGVTLVWVLEMLSTSRNSRVRFQNSIVRISLLEVCGWFRCRSLRQIREHIPHKTHFRRW